MKLLLLGLSLFLAMNGIAQEYEGDLVFNANKNKEVFEYTNINTTVQIGRFIHRELKHGIIFQEVDTIKDLYELRLHSFGNNSKEVVVDTLSVGILVDFQFIDKNRDGYRDLYITLGGNRAIDFLYVYEPEKDKLREVYGMDKFPGSEEILDSGFLYTYVSLGCGDSYWESKLIKIEDFKVKEYGSIYGNGCEENESDRYILIKDSNDHVDTLKYFETLKKYTNGKFDMIKSYWESIVRNQ
ncbi:hypothetical protein EYV94_02110 [Puteibacter caeruleilacunae]|nr:hypothetical protein EYV94_02110 [Puteibacter caeruleilacunae]